MSTYIKLKKDERIKLFYSARDNLKISFNNMYPRFKISRAMFFNYLAGRYDLPKNIFLELEKIANIKIKNYLEVEKERYIEKEILKPKLDSSLAEILGILNGDGHISPINYEICVVGSILEDDYLNYIQDLFEKTLKLKFTVLQEETKYKLRTYSKNMVEFLVEEYGLPTGNKMGKLKIPIKILKSKKLLVSYLRGLFDTDGTFYLRRKTDPVLEISSADYIFLKQVKDALITIRFNARISNTHISIYNKNHINQFFKIIKPANPKHLKKYQSYLKSCVGS